MVKVFRRIRQNLLKKGNVKRYLVYAIGEIFLVMVGILLALQVNNWNEQRKDRLTENELLTVLQEDLLVNMSRLENDILIEKRSISKAIIIVDHLDAKRPYDPSLDLVFKEAIFAPDIIIASSSYESIKFKGIDIIKGDSLKRGIINLYDVVFTNLIAETVRLENQFWPSSVLPMLHKHFRVRDDGHRPSNYLALLEDTAFTNMLADRTHFRKLALKLKTEALDKTKVIVMLVDKRKATLN